MARARETVNTWSAKWEMCLHEVGHYIVARELGWTDHKIWMRNTWLGGWDAGYNGDWAPRLSGDKLALQRAAVALGGVEVSRRRAWLSLPSSCSWDLNHAEEVLDATRISFSQAEAMARKLVGRHWAEIEAEARRLHLAGDRWRPA
ncbi:hypothetical protein K1T35_48160 (plasmid) [Pseudonocardia sp. DSM 110487]|uniref:hypothetical protein n=1 Tax=Pseudonocardia sp. DSM 110487 TaxID=2865833 RepID=UPI001C6A1BCC|nr:hypothetical protein [Pseudonocardia sp. DSM 110487]QYN41124.1 hypothetical protein K1T35_48160 [Pseudonocardia sp. DSM 110487]